MAPSATLRILQTSDVHMHLLPHDYFRDSPDAIHGLTRAADVIRDTRAEGTTLLLDTGDLLQGTPMAALMIGNAADRHPAVLAFKALEYDAVTLGNHDFNYGLDAAKEIYSAMPCPVVQSNVTQTDGNRIFPETAMLERYITDTDGAEHLIRIGVFGVVPPQILRWDRDHLVDRIRVEDMKDAAHRASEKLRRDGADLVIALAHTAPAASPQPAGAENRAHCIAALPEVDIVLAGHSHKMLPAVDYAHLPSVDARNATIHGKPAMMPGANASHIGRMELSLRRDEAGWRIEDHTAQLIALAGRPPCPELLKQLEPHHDKTRRYITQTIANTVLPLQGSGFAFGYDAAQVLMATAMQWRVKAQFPSEVPLVIATSPYRISSAPNGLCLPPGPINRCDIFTLYPFPNAMCVLRLTARSIKKWLENAARYYACQSQGTLSPLIDPTVPSYEFETLHGLHYRIDPFAALGNRIRDLRYDGAPLDADAVFHMATTTFRAHGGDDLSEAEILWTDTIPITDMIEDYLGTHGPFRLDGTLGWSLTPHEGQSTIAMLGDPPAPQSIGFDAHSLRALAKQFQPAYMESREVGAGERLANPVRSGRKQP